MTQHSCSPVYIGNTCTIRCSCGWWISETNGEANWNLAHGAAAEHLERQPSTDHLYRESYEGLQDGEEREVVDRHRKEDEAFERWWSTPWTLQQVSVGAYGWNHKKYCHEAWHAALASREGE